MFASHITLKETKMRIMWSIVFLSAVVALSGCATKRYGRVYVATDLSSMTIEGLYQERARVQSFIDEVENTGFDHRDAFAILGDLGIGNLMERSSALENGKKKLAMIDTEIRRRGSSASD